MLTIILDTGPLGLLTQRRGHPPADAARAWLAKHAHLGHRVIVPEIADFEVRRELLRAHKTASVARLDDFNRAVPDRYLPITTPVLRRAAELWAEARNKGMPTADPKELDADVILAAQALGLGLAPLDIVIATTNVGHISRFLAAEVWQNI